MLPAGWFRFFDEANDKFFYANVKLKQSSWVSRAVLIVLRSEGWGGGKQKGSTSVP